jgi:hypothetical protein
MLASLPPPLVVSVIGYEPASASTLGSAVTVMSPVAPALTVSVVACASLCGLAPTVQPSGPVAFIVNVVSAAVSLWSVTLNVNVEPAAAWSSGKSEVSVTAPAAASATRIVSGSVSAPPPPVATTRRSVLPAAAPSGISTSSVTSGVSPGVT